jgi:hypothetical protein
MPRVKQASKRKRVTSAVPALGAAVTELFAEPSDHPRRRGNRRRQSGDVLCVRQGEYGGGQGHSGGPWLWLSRLRWLQGLQGLQGLPRLRRLRRLRSRLGMGLRRLLFVVGILPHLLTGSSA